MKVNKVYNTNKNGMANVGVDRPTQQQVKLIATEKHMTMFGYIRYLLEQDAKRDPVVKNIIEGVRNAL